jgi:AraC family L-rhamnose operon transcriptional activator RhaR/AraC family L-rhamnose operon regulatory protein RhaS
MAKKKGTADRFRLYRLENAANPAFPFRVGKTLVEREFAEHAHEFSELVVILGGTATHLVEGERHFLTAGDVYVFQGSMRHGFYDCHELRMCNVGFLPGLLDPIAPTLKKLPGYQALFVLGPPAREGQAPRCRLRLSLADLKELETIIDPMCEEYGARSQAYEAVLTGMFFHLVAWLSRRYAARVGTAGDGVHRLALAVSHLERNFLEALRLEDLSARCGLSARQFLRVFKEHYGATPIDYVLRLRVHHAARLLQTTRAAVIDIAGASGFSDGNYFARQFRRVMGASPREYREANEKSRVG